MLKRFNRLLRVEALMPAVSAASLLCAAAVLIAPAPAAAQVVISTGVQGYYDDNIFLESGNPITITPESSAQIEQLSEKEIEQVDGEKDSSWITNPTIKLSTARPLSSYGNLQAEGEVGFLIFSSNSDENKISLDTMVRYESSEAFIPKPFYLILQDNIKSEAGDITVADGSAARQSEVNQAILNLGARQIKVAQDTELSASYQFQVNTYLGEFLLSGGDSDFLDEKGADYLQNSVDLILDHQVSKAVSAGLYGNIAVLTYSAADKDPLQPSKGEEDQDRIQSSDGVRVTYRINDKLEIAGSAGIDYSRFTNDQPPQEIAVVAPDGTVSTISEPVDSNETTLAYTGTIRYSPFLWTNIVADARQAIASDIDGDRFKTQVYSLNLSQGLTDWSLLGASARYTGFDRQDSLGDPTDRIELLATIRFTLTESMALVAGYSYIDQNADSIDGAQLIRSNEYEDNRIFVGISAGLVGLTN